MYMSDTVYRILSESEEVFRRYDKTFWLTVFPDTVFMFGRHQSADDSIK